MKTTTIQATNKALKKVAGLRDANREYTSISAVLRFMQTEEMLEAGFREAFATFGITGTLTVPAFFKAVPAENRTAQGEVGIWGTKTKKDSEGNVIAEEAVLRTVKSWTPNKVFKVLAQAAVVYATRKQLEGAVA